MDSAYCGLHNDKYTNYSPYKNCVFRALVKLWSMLEKYRISERNVYFLKRMGKRGAISVPDPSFKDNPLTNL